MSARYETKLWIEEYVAQKGRADWAEAKLRQLRDAMATLEAVQAEEMVLVKAEREAQRLRAERAEAQVADCRNGILALEQAIDPWRQRADRAEEAVRRVYAQVREWRRMAQQLRITDATSGYCGCPVCRRLREDTDG